MDDFMSSIADYIYCRREDIPVLKLEYQVFRKYFKYLWSPINLENTKERTDFTDEMLSQRIKYILGVSITYINHIKRYRKNWLSWEPYLPHFLDWYLNDTNY